MKRPVIIFDFGNVVAFFDYTLAFQAIGRSRGRDGAELFRVARESGLDDLVGRFESGRMTGAAFCEAACRLIEIDAEEKEFSAAWADIFRPNREIIPLIRNLQAAGHQLVLGSNTNALHARQFRAQFAETLAYFDRLVLSFEVGHIKPSTGFYLACVEAANAPARDCLFIDDLAENVEGARRAGLQGIQFRGVEDLDLRLRRLGLTYGAIDPERPGR